MSLIVQKPPDIKGPYGRAWRPQAEPGNIDQTATVDAWIVNLPQQHPWWPTYMFAVVSLADIPGARPANKRYPEAEYEFMIGALNPDGTKGHPLSTHDRESWVTLTPINVVVQFDNGWREEDAKDVCKLAVELAVLNGIGVEPDDDAKVRPYWESTIRNLADHARGAHAPFDGQHRG